MINVKIKFMSISEKKVVSEMLKSLILLGAKSDLIGTVASWKDTLNDEEAESLIRIWNEETKEDIIRDFNDKINLTSNND